MPERTRKANAKSRRRRSVVARPGKAPTVLPPDFTRTASAALKYLDVEFGSHATGLALVLRVSAARSRVKRLSEPVEFAEHPVRSTLEAVVGLAGCLEPIGDWQPFELRRAALALRRATDLDASFPPSWVHEIENEVHEIRLRAERLSVRLNTQQAELRGLLSEGPVDADVRSRERLAIIKEANIFAETQGRALTIHHLMALEISVGSRPIAPSQDEHESRIRQWRQLIHRQGVALATGSTHPDRVLNAERELSRLGKIQAASDIFKILMSTGKIRPSEYGTLLEDILARGTQVVGSEWYSRVVPRPEP